MLSLFGSFSLLAALIFSLLQSILPLAGAYKNNFYLIACAKPFAIGQFFFIGLTYVLLTTAFITNDFSLAYVTSNSHASLPLIYKLTAPWGGHEGSVLLWIFLLNCWTVACLFFMPKNYHYTALTLAFLGMISFCFLIFIIFTSNPFLTVLTTSQGFDLNPLLQDPGFIIHPPMLYMGYVGFSVTFALTLSALLSSNYSSESQRLWIISARRFAIAAWCFLTLGIMLGSWWAYRVLGWGGFWFWDPVENASLLPWIAGCALIHILILVEKRNTLKNWAIFLAIICFGLSLLGTFLVRSGILISVHSFANDPKRGIYLLLLLAFLLTLALFIFLWKNPRDQNKFHFKLLSRESSLLLNSALLMIVLLTILLGTLYPLALDILQLGIISVGAPYFNSVMTPFIFIILFFMGLAPFCSWHGQNFRMLYQKIWKKLLFSFVFSLFLQAFFLPEFDIITTISLFLCFWILTSIIHTDAPLGLILAHAGFVILILGITLSSLLSQETEVKMKPGQTVELGPYQFHFVNLEGVQGENYRSVRGKFSIFKNTRHVTDLHPEKRIYPVRNMVMTKADIHPGLFRDLYMALGEPLENDYWSIRLYYKPFIRWIWMGGVIMMVGGVLAIGRRKNNRVA